MGPATNRRDFVRILLAGAAGPAFASGFGAAGPAFASGFGAASFWPSHAMGQGSSRARSAITGTPLSDNLIHFTRADEPGDNIVVATGPDGLVMVNGGGEEMSADLLRAVAERTGGKRVQALFNTDWHREHTGSNETVGKAGAKII